jgi:hypothetical protein
MLARMFRCLGIAVIAACGIGATTGCAAASNPAASGEADYTKGGKLQLLVTVDWEGRDLRDDNIDAMKELHQKFPQVKVVNFLNAAYFTKSDADANADQAKIASAIGANDEKGLHIHGWKRLFEAAGVVFNGGPTFWGTNLGPQDCFYDCGHEVPLSNYAVADLRKVVKFSLDKLESQGFGRAKAFRCGGWMAKENVREAVAAEGLTYEESAVPASFLAPKLSQFPIQGWLSDLWAGTTQTSQPYRIATPAGELIEVPDNGALSDYVTADQMVGVYQANKAEWQKDPTKNVVVSVGFHEETAAMYLPILEAALTKMYDDAKASNIAFESVTTEELTLPPPAH